MKRYNNFNHHMILLGIIAPILVFFMSMNVTYSYFTATANKQETSTTTAIVKIQFTDETQAGVISSVATGSTTVIPGSKLKISGAVKNSGNATVYYIIEFKVEATKYGETEPTNVQSFYYVLSGSTLTRLFTKTDGTYSINATTLEANTTSSTFYVEYEFNFNEYDNSYKNATATYSLTAYAIQYANIENASTATQLLLEKATANNT